MSGVDRRFECRIHSLRERDNRLADAQAMKEWKRAHARWRETTSDHPDHFKRLVCTICGESFYYEHKDNPYGR